MNNKVFVATIEWNNINDKGEKVIPIKEPRYCPQILVDAEYVVDGSVWSVFCFNFEVIDLNKTKAYIKYLNQQSAPNNIKIGSKFELYEMGKVVAHGKVIDYSKIDF